jgi:hypothetical protein
LELLSELPIVAELEKITQYGHPGTGREKVAREMVSTLDIESIQNV